MNKIIDKRLCKDKNKAEDVFCLETLKNKHVSCSRSMCNSFEEKYFKKIHGRTYKCKRMNYRTIPCGGLSKPSWCPHLNIKDKQ